MKIDIKFKHQQNKNSETKSHEFSWVTEWRHLLVKCENTLWFSAVFIWWFFWCLNTKHKDLRSHELNGGCTDTWWGPAETSERARLHAWLHALNSRLTFQLWQKWRTDELSQPSCSEQSVELFPDSPLFGDDVNRKCCMKNKTALVRRGWLYLKEHHQLKHWRFAAAEDELKAAAKWEPGFLIF